MKHFTNKIILLIVVMAMSTFASAQNPSVSTIDETGDSLCDGIALFGNSSVFNSWYWSDGSDTLQYGGDTLANLCNGTYFLEYTDSIGANTHTFIIGTDTTTNPCANFYTSVTSLNTTGNGNCDGAATVTPTGGTAPYSYSWSPTGSTQTISNLCIGTYTVTTMDNNGCSYTSTITVGADSSNNTAPCANFTATATATNESSTGACDGTATVSLSGGNGNYTYSWAGNSATQIINGLCNGSYTVTVVDDSSCTATATTYVYSDSSANTNYLYGYITMANDETSAGGCDGEVEVVAYGGTAPYTYYHSSGATTAYVSSLCAGVYTVSITDAMGDSTFLSYLISSPANTVNNNNYQDSIVTDTIVSEIIENCVIDYSAVDSAMIDVYSIFAADSVEITWAIYDANGVTTVTEMYYIGGGNGVYSFQLSLNCSLKSNNNFLKVSDQLFFDAGQVGIIEVTNEMEVGVYPNPFNEQISISVEVLDSYTVSLYDISGKIVITKNYSATDLMTLDVKDLSKGQYILTIQNENNFITKQLVK